MEKIQPHKRHHTIPRTRIERVRGRRYWRGYIRTNLLHLSRVYSTLYATKRRTTRARALQDAQDIIKRL